MLYVEMMADRVDAAQDEIPRLQPSAGNPGEVSQDRSSGRMINSRRMTTGQQKEKGPDLSRADRSLLQSG